MRQFSGMVIMLSVVFAIGARAAESRIVEMRGFKVDFSAVTERDQKMVAPSLDDQLQIVEEANVPPAVMEFFRGVPLEVDPELQHMNGAYLQHRGRWIVRIKPTKLPRNRPIVLHELLHAYHHQVIKQPTPAVGRAYQQAFEEKIYPKDYYDAHFMENGKEYFAVIASIYLYDSRIDQPPFDCTITKKKQPQFIAFLAEHFGERQCK